ncbi:MAG: PEP-utilizing enzyme [Nanoarchaeota archaeon]
MKDLYDDSLEWVPYLTRPFNFFGTTMWQKYYSSNQIKKAIGAYMLKGLFIEYPKNTTRSYRVKEELDKFKSTIRDFISKNIEGCIILLKKGFELNKEADKYIKNEKYFSDLRKAIDFQLDLIVHSTILPYFIYMQAQEIGIENKEIKELAEKLRSVSYLANFEREVTRSLIIEKLRKAGFKDESYADIVTINELLEGDFSNIRDRKQQKDLGKYYLYENINGKENIAFLDDVTEIINNLDKIEISSTSELKGQSAFKGKVSGKARIVLSWDGKGQEFNKGDILISPSTSPNLISLMKKAAAFVTDEGGVMSHAAIVSRELKKPCIVGTKYATRIIKEGDLIEVDANNGTVKILK